MKIQRILGPVLFIILAAAFVACALATDRGRSLANPVILGQLAALSAGSQPLSALVLLVGLPMAGSFLLMPEGLVCALAAACLGPVAGSLLSLLALLGILLFFFALSRLLLHDDLRDLLADGRARAFLAARGLDGPLSLEACLFLEVLLLALPFLAVPVAGIVLGLTGIRPKAFALAAIPPLFVRAAIGALAGTSAAWYSLLVLALLGMALLVLFVWWLAAIFFARLKADTAEPASPRAVTRPRRQGVAEPVQDGASRPARRTPQGSRPAAGDAAAREDRPARGDAWKRGDAMVVIVRDQASRDEDIVTMIRAEAQALGLRTRVWDLVPRAGQTPARAGLPELAAPSSAPDHDPGHVEDLDRLFVRAFGEGAPAVLAVRAMTPLTRGEYLRRALDCFSRASVVIGPASGHGVLLLGLRREARDSDGIRRSYVVGTLAGRGFEGDLAGALSGCCPRPAFLSPLPVAAELTKPLASVIVTAVSSPSRALATVRSACVSPWSECLVPGAGESESTLALLAGAGATVLAAESDAAGRLGAAVRAARGQLLIFVQPGTQLPANFDAAAWETLAKPGCRLGAFSLPGDVALPRRGAQWLGATLRLSSLGLPVPAQGIFMERATFEEAGGFTAADDVRACLDGLVERAAALGRVVLHNARVTLLPGETPESGGEGGEAGDTPKGVLARVRGGCAAIARELALRSARPFRKDADGGAAPSLDSRIEAMVEDCDHCGRCTRACPSLARHGLDLRGLAGRPLLAWHNFMCGAARAACPKGIDDVRLVRLLRERFVREHGGRVTRPGHGATLLMGRFSPLVTRLAAPGENLLLDLDFCLAYPRTAAALTRLAQDAGRGVICADSGARIADLGMAEAAAGRVEELRRVMARHGATRLLTVSPLTHEHLVLAGLPVSPVYGHLRAWGVEGLVGAARRVLLTPCADRARGAFAAALEPFLEGDITTLDQVPCCGAGGEAAVLEPALAARMKGEIRMTGRPVITTCARCAVTLERAGCPVVHPLAVLTGTGERPASGFGRVRGLARLLSVLRSPLTPIRPEPLLTEPVAPVEGSPADLAARDASAMTPAPASDAGSGSVDAAGPIPAGDAKGDETVCPEPSAAPREDVRADTAAGAPASDAQRADGSPPADLPAGDGDGMPVPAARPAAGTGDAPERLSLDEPGDDGVRVAGGPARADTGMPDIMIDPFEDAPAARPGAARATDLRSLLADDGENGADAPADAGEAPDVSGGDAGRKPAEAEDRDYDLELVDLVGAAPARESSAAVGRNDAAGGLFDFDTPLSLHPDRDGRGG